MALNGALMARSAVCHLGNDDLGYNRSGLLSNRKIRVDIGVGNWGCANRLSGFSVYGKIRFDGEAKSSKNGDEFRQEIDETENNSSKELQRKDSTSLPKPLSVSDLSAPLNCRSKKNLRIAFKGKPGAYGEDAALKAYPLCMSVPCDEFEDAFKAVELWLADKAVLPIENSLGGSIHRNYDLLLRHKLHIVGEVQLPVNLCLLALPGVKTEQLKRVLSHPQALAQSDGLLSKLGLVRESVGDAAAAAEFVASNCLGDAGVIASSRAAEIYGLNVLAKGIQDDPDSITRFLVLARDPIIARADKAFKTSIVFTMDEGPGVLFKALAVFALRGINLTKMESRPQRKRSARLVDDSDNGSAKFPPRTSEILHNRHQYKVQGLAQSFSRILPLCQD